MTARARIILLVTVAPLAAAAIAIVTLLLLAPQLPAKLAVHWGPSGAADRVDGIGSLVALIAVLVTILTALMVVAVVTALRAGTSRRYLRLVVVVSVAFGIAISGGVAGSALAQRGAATPAAVPVSAALIPLAIAIVVALGAAVVIARFVPAVPEAAGEVGAASAGLDLAATESVYWAATVVASRAMLAIIFGTALLLAVLIPVLGLPWWTELAVLLVFTVPSSTLRWRVVADRRGLRATGALGFPWYSVPADRVTGATAVEVRALRQFGGWGIRLDGRGRTGIIVRSGSAIQVDRTKGGPFVITVPDAATGAAVLAAVARGANPA